MKIEIEYNGAFAVCRIEPMDEPGRMVNFNEADTKSQTYALDAFRTIEEHWRREKQLERYKKHPVMHIRREFQVMPDTFDQIQELSHQGVIFQWSFDARRDPTISIELKDRHTTVETGDWLLQDTEGRWWGMENGYHRMLEYYGKIVKG